MTHAEAKNTRKKSVIVEKVKRRSMSRRLDASLQGAVHHPADCSIANQRPTIDSIGSTVDAANGNRGPAPETTAGEDGQESHGSVHEVTIHRDSMVESKASEFSPGKDPNLSVANYASQIGQNWERGVDAFMTIARLCAEASARLTIAKKGELLKQLPFGDSAFSKFVQIGNDHRLNTPELRRLLPPHYTITYAVTLLTDQELEDAITEKVIHPDMRRGELQKWRNSHRELSTKGGFASSAKEAATDSAVASPPMAPAHDESEEKAAGEIAALKADLAKNKGAVGTLGAKMADQRQCLRELKDAPDVDYDDTGISITSPGTVPSLDQDIVTNPPPDIELLIERHATEVDGFQNRIRQLEEELSNACQIAPSPLVQAASPATDVGDLTIPPFLMRRVLSEDEQRQADELERVWVKCCPLVRQRHWAKYARDSVSTTQAPTSSNIR